MYANRINQAIQLNKYLEEIHSPLLNIAILNSDEMDLYNDYCWNILSVPCFKMSEQEYREALIGFPITDAKTHGISS